MGILCFNICGAPLTSTLISYMICILTVECLHAENDGSRQRLAEGEMCGVRGSAASEPGGASQVRDDRRSLCYRGGAFDPLRAVELP